MENLSTLDAGFLQAENSDPHVSLAIGAVSIMAGPPPCFDELISVLAERVRAIPRFTQILRTYWFDLRAPYWSPDPNFDISRHVYRVALAEPGDDIELFRMVATAMQQRLDRERPLWECWIIEGLTENRWAFLVKLHHCIADGVSATKILTRLSDSGDPEGAESVCVQTDSPNKSEYPLLFLSRIWKWPRDVRRAAVAAEHVGAGAIELATGLLGSPHQSSLTGSLTTLRHYAAVQVKLADLFKVSRAFDVTINDVALAAITFSYRKLLLSRGEVPRRDSARTLVPVSVRSVQDLQQAGNQVSAMLPLLPVDEADPAKQLELVHRRTSSAKRGGQREGGTTLMAVADSVPFALSAWTMRLLARFPQRGVSALATNVPGPAGRLSVLGRKVLGVLPVPPIAFGLRTGIAMVSYADAFAFGITADRDAFPDIDQLASGISLGVTNLLALARKRRRRPRKPTEK